MRDINILGGQIFGGDKEGTHKMNRAHIYWAFVPGSVLAARMAPVGPFTFKDLGGGVGGGLTTFEDLRRFLPFSVHRQC